VTRHELSRREAFRRFGMLGIAAIGSGRLGAMISGQRRGGLERLPRVLADVRPPAPPPDVAHGVGAWRMIDWGSAYEAFVDVPTWRSRGWGGFAVGFDYLTGYGGNQDFTASSQLGNDNPVYEFQRYIEHTPGTSLPKRCHEHGCEAYLGTHFWSRNFGNSKRPPWGDWFDTKLRADVATKIGRVAAFCNWIGMDGLKADTEFGLWDETSYDGNDHSEDETLDQVGSWGRAVGAAIFQTFPSAKMLVYPWHPPGGWEDTFVYKQDKSKSPMTHFWTGYLEAMAEHGNNDSRLIVADPFFYKPTSGVGGVPLENALKYHTQGSIAWLSKNLPAAAWNRVCDRVDMTMFSWAGTDSKDEGYYKHTGEPAFADQLHLFRRYAMGPRRANYTNEGSPDRYCWIDHTHPAPELADHKFDQANNWYVVDTKSGPNDAPGGHLPGLRAAASREPVNRTPPTLSVKPPVDNDDGSFTVTGSAFHTDGIRCVRGYVHPSKRERVAAQMTFNTRGGTPQTNLDRATQDFTMTVNAEPGEYLMVTVVSVHDQQHSERVKL
jgi:hypothetical protein